MMFFIMRLCYVLELFRENVDVLSYENILRIDLTYVSVDSLTRADVFIKVIKVKFKNFLAHILFFG